MHFYYKASYLNNLITLMILANFLKGPKLSKYIDSKGESL